MVENSKVKVIFVLIVDTKDKKNMSNIIKEAIDETVAELEKMMSQKQRIFFQTNKRNFFIGAIVIISIEVFILIGGWQFIEVAYQYLEPTFKSTL